MNVYVFAADLYCATCGAAIRARLTAEGKAPADPDDERTYDSDDYPKGPYPDGGGESDTVQHCASGATCLNALPVRSMDPRTGKRRTYRVGVWLENPLTTDGVAYVKDAVAERPRGLVAHLWRKWYAEELSA